MKCTIHTCKTEAEVFGRCSKHATLSLTVQGLPLSSAGLDKLVMRFENGSEVPITGLLVSPGQTIKDALAELAEREQCTIHYKA